MIREPSAYEQPGTVEWVSGACVLVRRTVLEQLGGLDEGFFHYSEDMDLCARIWKAGYEIRYVPGGPRRARGRRVGAPARAAADPRREPHPLREQARQPAGRAARRAGVALGSATHAVVSKGGWPARRGHLRSLAVALTPLPSDPSRLVRGSRAQV